ncbi:MAG: DUF11 domain-containing protein, partial [Firmicutes bacterium]|nr:DUF11 domain-containing protein [Bacillota bacterium]
GYENAYKESDGHYREFVVGGQGVIVYMANPKTVTLDITKYVYGDTSKTPVSGMTFKLTKAGSTNLSDVLTATQKDGENGVYYNFASIPTGKYVLTETGNGSTVSSRYFAELFAQKYPDLAAMVGAGYDFGYTYGSKTIYEKIDGQDVAVGSDVTITAISPWEGTAETGAPILSLDVENPPLDELMVVKKDLEDDETNLSASFIVYYKPFTQITGSYTLDLPAAASTYAATKTNYDTIVNAERNDPKGWKRLSGKDFSSTPKNLTGLEPGVYVFLESATPSQYERVLDSSGKMLVYTAVVTGGLSVNVTVNPSQATVPGITDPVKTNFTKESGSMINVVARNRKMAPMYAKKSTLPARWNLDSPRLNWKVTLNVYDAQTGGTLLGSAVIDNSTNQNVNNGKGIQFTKDNQPVYFSVDKTYYLEEVIETAEAPAVDADHFIWTSLTVQPYTVNGAVGTPVNVDVTPGVRYPVAVSSSGGLTVTATNQYLYGEVTFIKYNGDQSDTVHGVTFVVETYNAETDKWETYAPASVEEIKNGETPTGRYRAFIPLDGPDPKTYRIREVRAPHGFVMDPDPTKRYIDVSLSAENNKVDYTNNPAPGQYLKNYPGSGLSVIKYRNIHSAVTKDQAYAPAGTAEFTLYHETTNGWVLEEGPVSVTGTQGEVKFTTTLYPGEKYAVVETWFRADSIDGTDFTGFNGLESMWVNGSEAVLGKITVNGTDIENAYVFTSDGATAIVIEAYNIPNLNPTLAKVDVGKFPQNVRANMGFKVFLVEDDFVADAASVKDLVDNISDTATGVPRVVFKGTTDLNYELQEPDETYLGTKKLWAGVDKIEDRWDPTKKYVLVEVEVGSTTESTYATMVKDDPRVTWFKVIEPVSSPTQAYLDENPYVLKNINGVANVTIEKNVIEKVEEPYNDSDVVNGKVESLLEGSRKVAYTLKPNVTGMGQMLTSFILTENGLIRNGTAESPVYDDSIPDYTIDKVLVGGASQVIPTAFGYTGAQPPEIKAIVTFDNGDSQTVTFSVPYLLSETIEVVPEHTGAKSFTVEYYCEYVMDKTEDETTGEPAYKLGEEFRVGTSTVYMTIKKAAPGQPNGGNPGGQAPGTDLAKEILKFTNRTEAALSYPEWDKYGVKAAQPTTKSDYDTAEVEVKKVVLPTVSIQKSAALAEGQTVVETNSTLNYTIKIKNTSSTEKFEDPVVLDILPTGVTYQSNQTPSVTPTGIIKGIEVVPKVGVATRQIEKRDEQGNIIPGEYYSDAETAVIFKMSGTLEPQQEITLTFSVLVGESALIY